MKLLAINNSAAIIINAVIVIIFINDIKKGYKKGFIQTVTKFISSVITIAVVFLFKTALSSYLYTKYPFFQLNGIFSEIPSINIIIYEGISIIILCLLTSIALKIIKKIFKIDEKITQLIKLAETPNKIAGGILGAMKSIVELYFLISVLTITSNVFNLNCSTELSNYITNIPILNNTFGHTVKSSEELNDLVSRYNSINNPDELNKKAIDILLEYDIISEEDLNILISSGKIDYTVYNSEEQKDRIEDLNDILNR